MQDSVEKIYISYYAIYERRGHQCVSYILCKPKHKILYDHYNISNNGDISYKNIIKLHKMMDKYYLPINEVVYDIVDDIDDDYLLLFKHKMINIEYDGCIGDLVIDHCKIVMYETIKQFNQSFYIMNNIDILLEPFYKELTIFKIIYHLFKITNEYYCSCRSIISLLYLNEEKIQILIDHKYLTNSLVYKYLLCFCKEYIVQNFTYTFIIHYLNILEKYKHCCSITEFEDKQLSKMPNEIKKYICRRYSEECRERLMFKKINYTKIALFF